MGCIFIYYIQGVCIYILYIIGFLFWRIFLVLSMGCFGFPYRPLGCYVPHPSQSIRFCCLLQLSLTNSGLFYRVFDCKTTILRYSLAFSRTLSISFCCFVSSFPVSFGSSAAVKALLFACSRLTPGRFVWYSTFPTYMVPVTLPLSYA